MLIDADLEAIRDLLGEENIISEQSLETLGSEEKTEYKVSGQSEEPP